MASKRDLAADLAEEIRRAVAETAPEEEESAPAVGGTGEEEAARSALQRAHAHLTPTIPEAAPLSRIKRIALRLLRFVWRDQAAFNALALEAGNALVVSAASQGRLLEQMSHDLARLEKGFESLRAEKEGGRAAVERIIAAFERRWSIEEARLALLEASASRSNISPSPAASEVIPPGVYSLFEERFRGTPEKIAEKQRSYLPLLEGIPGPVLDAGCGRGEFLRLLAERGIPASGVDLNPIALAECRRAGLTVEEKDALASLGERPAGSLGAVVAFQLVEHWPAQAVYVFLREARRALAPGGVVLVETINTDSLSSWKAFYLDPSHVRPVPPESLKFLAEAAGFADAKIEYRSPLPPEERLEESGANEAKLNRLLFAPQDYALIARVPRAEDGRREAEGGRRIP